MIVVRMVQRLSTREDDGFSIITSSPVKLYKGYGFLSVFCFEGMMMI